MIMHFKTEQERLDFVKGKLVEIEPKVAKPKKKAKKKAEEKVEEKEVEEENEVQAD